MSFSPSAIEQARREINGAPYKSKSTVAARWARLLGISMQTVYDLIRPDAGGRARKGEPVKPEYREWTRIIFMIKKRPPQDAGEISTEDAVQIAVGAQLIPAEALQVPVSTFNAIARGMGLHKRKKRRNYIQAERPNDAHHMDASTAKFLYIARDLGNDEYLLKLHRPGKMGYKNKPIPVNALRPWYYGLVDDHSGYGLTRCTAAPGESSVDSMSFLAWAWARIGLCKELDTDQGMLKKALASTDLVERLGVALPPHVPYEKEAHGKIERPWRTLWQKFEMLFFAQDDWQKFEITLSELNRRLMIYIEDKYNEMPHRFERDITRRQAWSRINLYGGIITLPENALATVAKRKRRKVDIAGKLEYEGADYEVKGLHDAWVWVYEGVFEDRLVVQEIETGRRFEVRDFKPLTRGEYRAHADTPHQKLVKESENIIVPAAAIPYQEKKASDEKVVEMPTRIKEDREIEDPFDVEHYASMDEAMQDLFSIAGYIAMTEAERRDVETLIRQHEMSRSYVREIALGIRALYEQRRAIAGGA